MASIPQESKKDSEYGKRLVWIRYLTEYGVRSMHRE